MRALAVLAVVLFHLDHSWVPGGFAGVDIFFVISGFVITSNLIREHDSDGWSLLEFYRRRIRRIFPVLFVVVLFTLFVGQLILLPEDLNALSRSAIAAVLSVANIYFTYFLDTSYFAEDAALQPLLHLWSLGVEEQFYLLWPILLIAGLRRLQSRTLLFAVVSAAVGSFALAQWCLDNGHSMFAYYMLPTRAGQLLLGAVCALLVCRGVLVRSQAGSEVGSALGLLIVLASLVVVDEATPFPGVFALPVTIGTAALIYLNSNRMTAVGRLFSARPIVAVGLISYSMYLWHWPLLAYLKYAVGTLPVAMKLLSFGAIVLLSAASYRLVEVPMRTDSSPFAHVFRRKFLFPSAALVVVCILLLMSGGLGLYVMDKNYVTRLERLPAEPLPAPDRNYVCQRRSLSPQLLAGPECRINSEVEPKILMWGDSNSAHYVGALKAFAEEQDFGFRNIAHSSCPPLLDRPERFVQTEKEAYCRESAAVVREVLHRYPAVIMSAAWEYYISSSAEFLEAFENTLLELRASGTTVLVIGRIPIIPKLDVACRRKRLKLGFLNCDVRDSVSRDSVEQTNSLIREAAERGGATYVDFVDLLCDEDNCFRLLAGKNVYKDMQHLSASGMEHLGTIALADEGLSSLIAGFVGSSVSRPPNAVAVGQRNGRKEPVWRDMKNGALLSGRRAVMELANGDLRLSDESESEYLVWTYQPEIVVDAGASLEFALKARAHGSARFLLRVSVKEREGTENYDFLVEPGDASVVTRGSGVLADHTCVSDEQDLECEVEIPSSSERMNVSVHLFPAGSRKDVSRYSKEATGTLDIVEFRHRIKGHSR